MIENREQIAVHTPVLIVSTTILSSIWFVDLCTRSVFVARSFQMKKSSDRAMITSVAAESAHSPSRRFYKVTWVQYKQKMSEHLPPESRASPLSDHRSCRQKKTHEFWGLCQREIKLNSPYNQECYSQQKINSVTEQIIWSRWTLTNIESYSSYLGQFVDLDK